MVSLEAENNSGSTKPEFLSHVEFFHVDGEETGENHVNPNIAPNYALFYS